MEKERIRILLADDHNLVRAGIAQLLSIEADMEVVGEAADGLEAYATATALKPDLVLVDLAMPRSSGFEAIEQIRADVPGAIVVALTYSEDPEDMAEALRRGAQGYLLKSLEPCALAPRIREAVRGVAPLAPLGEAAPQMTPRELEILSLVAEGANNREIGTRLSLSENTVKHHLKHILAKLQVENRAQAVARAFRVGVLAKPTR